MHLPISHRLLQWYGLQHTMSGCLAVWQAGVLFSCSTVLRSGHRHSRQHMTDGSANRNGRTTTHSAASTPPVSTARSSVSSCLSSSRLNSALRNCRSSDSTGGDGCAGRCDVAAAATDDWAAAVDAEEVFSEHLASLSRRTRAFHKRLANAVRLLLNMNIKHVNAASHLVATTSADSPNRILRWSAGGRRDARAAAAAPWYVIAACVPRFPDASVSGRPLSSVRRRPRRCRRRRCRYNVPPSLTATTTTTAAATARFPVILRCDHTRRHDNNNIIIAVVVIPTPLRATHTTCHRRKTKLPRKKNVDRRTTVIFYIVITYIIIICFVDTTPKTRRTIGKRSGDDY